MSDTLLKLRSGLLEIELNPSVGGSISRFSHTLDGLRTPILRESHGDRENILEAASFPLVPFVNRIRGGTFAFRGRTVRLAPNMAGDASPLHGQGWLHPWKVESVDAGQSTVSYLHAAGEWPWDYAATQHFDLDSDGLSIALTCCNLSSEPMPCGLGQHPYFQCGPETRIDTKIEHAWTIDEQVLPVEKVPASGRFDLRHRFVCAQDLDHGFGGWAGSALLTDPGWPFDLRLSSPTARFFQLYSPASGAIFVAEPVSHANAALNAPEEEWPELGMTVLEPDQELRLDMRLEVVAKGGSRSG